MKLSIQNIKFTASKSSGEVSGIIVLPEKPKFLLLFAHGAGAGMKHLFMEKISLYLADEGIGTFRFNFPYSEKNLKRPDPAPILQETIRSALKSATDIAGNIPLIAGGKSMGGRMTSLADSVKPLDGAKGIVFFGFPLHSPGSPSSERSEHLFNVNVPMLFLQGTRDKLANLDILEPIVKKLENKALLHIVDGADHSFHVLKSSGKSDEEILKGLARTTAEWSEKL